MLEKQNPKLSSFHRTVYYQKTTSHVIIVLSGYLQRIKIPRD